MQGYFTISQACGMFQKLLKALKFSFSAQGKTTNLKIICYTPSEGEIFREIEPMISEMIATGEAVKEIGPVILERMQDDKKFYNFRMRFALGTLTIAKEDLIKVTQGSLLEGFEGLVESINDIEIGDDETVERQELIQEAEQIGVVWVKPLDEYELYEIRDAIAIKRLTRMNEGGEEPCAGGGINTLEDPDEPTSCFGELEDTEEEPEEEENGD